MVKFNPLNHAVLRVMEYQHRSLDRLATGVPQCPSEEIKSLERLLPATNVLLYALRCCEDQMSDADYREVQVWVGIAKYYLGIR